MQKLFRKNGNWPLEKKKVEEMAKRIDTLERNLKQMEPPANPISEEEQEE